MTNLLEKALLLGFSIFLLAVFSAILFPFLGELNEHLDNEQNELEIYTEFLDDVNEAVLFITQNPKESYLQEIQYPRNLNLTIFETYIISEFLIEGKIYSKTSSYNTSFHNCFFHNLPSQKYLLNVSYPQSNIIIDFINLH
ncbi:MAG: hypothetical protein ACXAAH_09670 [Promethearchaeota archaeon]|jgi:hypothetical protein